MKQTLTLLFAFALLLITAHRLPAPIQETPESPTPALEQSAKPRHAKSNVAPSKADGSEKTPAQKAVPRSSPPRSKFAGTWVGTMQTFPWGNWAIVLTVDANEATMTEKINDEKPEVRPARRNGEMLQARFPAGFTTITWSLTPQPDGTTANVHFAAFMNDFSAVFHRTANAPPAAKSTTNSAPLPTLSDLPTARPVAGKPGYVYNPYDPSAMRLLDVRGKPSGTRVKDPISGKLFIVP